MLSGILKESQQFYSILGDNISKQIYEARVMYSLTQNPKYIRMMALTNKEVIQFSERMDYIDKRQPKVIYSAGIRGQRIAQAWNYEWTAFVDQNSQLWGKTRQDIPIISLEEMLDLYKNAVVIIPNRVGWTEIEQKLIGCGIKKESIINIAKTWDDLTKRQYFDVPELECFENEIFVDCGMYDGESSRNFLKWCKNRYSHVYAFEPDYKNIAIGKAHISGNMPESQYTLINSGLWNTVGSVAFISDNDMGSAISINGEEEIHVTTLDNEFEKIEVSFIKMDIEGAELQALQGGCKIISKYSPKLAICVYHKLEDIFTIPQFLLQFSENYTFYLRHYSYVSNETVLYAIPKKKFK